jgi:hypothetical protein
MARTKSVVGSNNRYQFGTKWAVFEKTVYSIVVGSGKKGFNSSYTQQTINMKEDALQAAIASGRAEMGAT